MKPSPAQTLDDLRDQFRLYAVCSPCGRTKELDINTLIARFGGRMTLQQIRSRVRCGACHYRTQDVRIVYAGPDDRPTEFRYRKT